MTTTILVTGATGNVGPHVVRELRNRGVTVRAFVRDAARGSVTLGADVELVTGDFTNVASLETAMRGADGIFIATPNHPQQAELEQAVIDAAAAGAVGRVVKLSSIGAAIGAPLEFWNAQGRCESHVRAALPNAVILRSNFYMTNLLGAAERVKTLGKIFAPAGDARIAMVDPRDVATVAALLLTTASNGGETITVTGPDAITYSRVAETLSDVAGKPVVFVNVPDEVARQAMVGAGMPEWIAGNLVQLFSLLREGAGAETTTTFRDLTGREPRSFADFARDHAPAFCR